MDNSKPKTTDDKIEMLRKLPFLEGARLDVVGTGYGVEGTGDTAGGYFKDGDSSGHAYVGEGHYGIKGYGDLVGGYFKDLNGTGYASVGVFNNGIEAHGTLSGGAKTAATARIVAPTFALRSTRVTGGKKTGTAPTTLPPSSGKTTAR